MQKAVISIVYHSTHGHTKQAARLLSTFLHSTLTEVHLIHVDEAEDRWQDMHRADALVFGCPTLFGNVSAGFKAFMESTGSFWYQQAWKNKIAAAFTVSSSTGADQLHTLQSLAIFAARHSMHWVSLGVLPRFCSDQQTSGQNHLASYLGLMLQADKGHDSVEPFHPGAVLTIERFANRLLDVMFGCKNIKINKYETIRD